MALEAVEQAPTKLTEEHTTHSYSDERSRQFASRISPKAGQRLPEIWQSLSATTRKSLLRTLVHGVNLLRQPDGTVQIRIVWPGGLVSEQIAQLPVFTLRDTELEAKLIERIRQWTNEGLGSAEIAERLDPRELHPLPQPTT